MKNVRELFDLTGKTAFVTGGSRGLGLEMAEGLGEAGAAVVVTARRRQWLDQAEASLTGKGIPCLALETDVADAGQVDSSVAQAVEKFGAVDVLVNAAGTAWGALAEEMPIEKWRQVLDVNLTGTFLMSQAVGRRMIAGKKGGKIVNIASIAGLVGTPTEKLSAVGYSASKAAVIGLTRDLAVKWARHGIYVNAIAPGFFPTKMTEAVLERSRRQIEEASPLGRTGQTGEIKGVAVFLASAASNYITGQVIAVDGGTTAW